MKADILGQKERASGTNFVPKASLALQLADQPIATLRPVTAAFFGSVSSSTPSAYLA